MARNYWVTVNKKALCFSFLIQLLLAPELFAQDQCESVLRHAGTDETIVSSEIQRIRNFVSDFCSSNESTHEAYNNSSQGLKVGFKGFNIGGSSASDSQRLDQIKNSLCTNQQQANSDFEKSHKETRRATREAISAWDNCMSRNGLVAKATVSGEKTVIVVMIYRPNSIGDTARVFKPYDAERKTRCDFIGDPALANQETFQVGPAGVNFVCRRAAGSDRMTIVLSSDKAFINGNAPIQVEPFPSTIQIVPPKVATPESAGSWASRLTGASCAILQMPPPGGADHFRKTCVLDKNRLTCAVARSPNFSHPVFSHQLANDPSVSVFTPPDYWVGTQPGPFLRMYVVFEIFGQISNPSSKLVFRPIVGYVAPPNVFGVLVEAFGTTDHQETSFVADSSGTPAKNLFFGPPLVWRKCG